MPTSMYRPGIVLTSHQPDFLPYMGFFYKAARSDILVFSDDVQFSKKGMHNWNRIKTPDGVRKLTVPVHAHHDTKLRDIPIADQRHSLETVIKTIKQNYRRSPHYEECLVLLDCLSIYANALHTQPMAMLNRCLTLLIMDRFGMNTRIALASDLGISGHKDDRIFQMCEKLGASTYLSGRGAADYHQSEEYRSRGIDLVYTDYQPFEYPQLYGEFVENLSVIDYVMNCGFELPRGWER